MKAMPLFGFTTLAFQSFKNWKQNICSALPGVWESHAHFEENLWLLHVVRCSKKHKSIISVWGAFSLSKHCSAVWVWTFDWGSCANPFTLRNVESQIMLLKSALRPDEMTLAVLDYPHGLDSTHRCRCELQVVTCLICYIYSAQDCGLPESIDFIR